MEENKRHFLFSMTEPYNGNEYKFEETIDDYDIEYQSEIDYLLDQFKAFLKAMGYTQMTVDRLQYLEDDEFRYVLKAYGEWTSEHEKYFGEKK